MNELKELEDDLLASVSYGAISFGSGDDTRGEVNGSTSSEPLDISIFSINLSEGDSNLRSRSVDGLDRSKDKKTPLGESSHDPSPSKPVRQQSLRQLVTNTSKRLLSLASLSDTDSDHSGCASPHEHPVFSQPASPFFSRNSPASPMLHTAAGGDTWQPSTDQPPSKRQRANEATST
jgi:hypothetical protein